ncbi:unnamed protein product [Meloidogyne enterolobii]|uniref:Uncharacterized protein n=1 Tax=Meloidogyne enterolobii TaxID=390850 RepID=A0ACB1AFR2_MELEN
MFLNSSTISNYICSIKQKNLYFRDFINNFEYELAREKLLEISIKLRILTLIYLMRSIMKWGDK